MSLTPATVVARRVGHWGWPVGHWGWKLAAVSFKRMTRVHCDGGKGSDAYPRLLMGCRVEVDSREFTMFVGFLVSANHNHSPGLSVVLEGPDYYNSLQYSRETRRAHMIA